MKKKTKIFKHVKDIKKYIRILESKGIHVEEIILYGSQASGTARGDSDIDIVVISKDLKRYNFPERLSFLSRATLDITAPIEVIGYTPEEIKNKKGESIFWDEICSVGKVIYKTAA